MASAPLAELGAELPPDCTLELNVPISSLRKHPRNPRRGNREKIRASIRAHGFADVVLAQATTRHVIAGWHRIDVAREEGYEVAPIVIWADVDDAEAERRMLAYNKASDEADYDLTILRDVLVDLSESTDGLDGTLWVGDELGEITRQLERESTPFDDLAGAISPGGPDPVAGGAVHREEFRQVAFYLATEEDRREILHRLRSLKDAHELETDSDALLHALRTHPELA